MLTKLSLSQLYNSKSHIGYSRDSYFKLIKDFIFASKVDYFILDVVKTLNNLKLAIWFSFYIAVYSNKILFIHNIPESFIYTFGLIFKVFGHFTLKTKWRSGTLTNFRRIRKHYRYLYIKYIKDYKIYKKLTFFTYYNKKLAPQICDFLFIRRFPSFLVVLSAFNSDIAVREGFVVRIPSIGFNSNRSIPFGLTFPIISNDVSEETFVYFLFLYKNLMYKSLYYRRLDFFNLLFKNIYINSSLNKNNKLKIYLPFLLLLKNIFFFSNFSKYKNLMIKYNKHLKKKVSYMLFVKYKKKRYFKYKNYFFFYRKERKKSNFYIRTLFSNSRFNFFSKILNHIKSFFLFRKNFFLNIFFILLSKKKYVIQKKILKKQKVKILKYKKFLLFFPKIKMRKINEKNKRKKNNNKINYKKKQKNKKASFKKKRKIK